MSKQILLYLSSAGMTDADLKALRDADIVPIRVNNFSDVRIVDPMSGGERSAVWMAAMEAISKASGKEGPRTMFGRLLAEKLSGADFPKPLSEPKP